MEFVGGWLRGGKKEASLHPFTQGNYSSWESPPRKKQKVTQARGKKNIIILNRSQSGVVTKKVGGRFETSRLVACREVI